jgi:hypothetical protein
VNPHEVEDAMGRTKARIEAARRDEKAARKSKSAFAPLVVCDARLRIVAAEEDLRSLQQEELRARLEQTDRELEAVAESEGLAVQEPPASGSKQATLEIGYGRDRFHHARAYLALDRPALRDKPYAMLDKHAGRQFSDDMA